MSNAVQKLNNAHEQMMLWVLENPGGTLREMSAVFGYTVPWLCQVVNSDMFKAAIAEKMGDLTATVMADIPTKLRGTAALAIERVTEVLQTTEDKELIVDAFDKVMHRYGYAPNSKNPGHGSGPVMQQNNFFLTKDEFARARGALMESHVRALPALEAEDAQLVPAT